MSSETAPAISPAALKDLPIAPSAITDIVNTETEYLKTKQIDYQREKLFLQHSVREGDEQVSVLTEQRRRRRKRDTRQTSTNCRKLSISSVRGPWSVLALRMPVARCCSHQLGGCRRLRN